MRAIPAWLVFIGDLSLVEVGENEVGEPVEPQVEPRPAFNGLRQGTRGRGSDECGRATGQRIDQVLPHRSTPCSPSRPTARTRESEWALRFSLVCLWQVLQVGDDSGFQNRIPSDPRDIEHTQRHDQAKRRIELHNASGDERGTETHGDGALASCNQRAGTLAETWAYVGANQGGEAARCEETLVDALACARLNGVKVAARGRISGEFGGNVRRCRTVDSHGARNRIEQRDATGPSRIAELVELGEGRNAGRKNRSREADVGRCRRGCGRCGCGLPERRHGEESENGKFLHCWLPFKWC